MSLNKYAKVVGILFLGCNQIKSYDNMLVMSNIKYSFQNATCIETIIKYVYSIEINIGLQKEYYFWMWPPVLLNLCYVASSNNLFSSTVESIMIQLRIEYELRDEYLFRNDWCY